jgi:hypothetical protein
VARRHIEHFDDGDDQDVVIRMGREELLIRRRYQTVSIPNGFLIGVWFLLGSVAFFWPRWGASGSGCSSWAAPSC